MRTTKRHIALVLTGLFLLSFLASCSDKGVHMPKHRKRRNCDCPTFSYNSIHNSLGMHRLLTVDSRTHDDRHIDCYTI